MVRADGCTVITSREEEKIPNSVVLYEERIMLKDSIVWKFSTQYEAIRASREFIEAGFESVQRII